MGVVDGGRCYLVPLYEARCSTGVEELAFLRQTGESLVAALNVSLFSEDSRN